MKGKDLIDKLKPFEDFEVDFAFSECKEGDKFLTIRKFKDIEISDVSYSEKIVVLDGTEVV